MSDLTTIRGAIISRLAQAGLVPDGHIWDSPTVPVEDLALPAIAVTTGRSEARRLGGAVYRVETEMVIQATATEQTDAQIAAAVDTLEAGILQALLSREIAGVEQIAWQSTHRVYAAKDYRYGAALITCMIQYTEAHDATDGAMVLERVRTDVAERPTGWEIGG